MGPTAPGDATPLPALTGGPGSLQFGQMRIILSRKSALRGSWLKWAAVAGFLVFFIKGLVWLAVGVVAVILAI